MWGVIQYYDGEGSCVPYEDGHCAVSKCFCVGWSVGRHSRCIPPLCLKHVRKTGEMVSREGLPRDDCHVGVK